MSSKARGGSAALSRSLPVDGESAKPVGGAAAKLFGGASAKLRQAVAAVRAEASGDMWKKAIVSVQPEAAAALAAKEAAKNYGNVAFDMSGRPHDIAELRERRNTAIVKGLKMMHKFFKKKNFEALHEVGDDAPSIFFECWYTSANSSIRMQSKAICKQLMPKYELLGLPRIASDRLGSPRIASDRLIEQVRVAASLDLLLLTCFPTGTSRGFSRNLASIPCLACPHKWSLSMRQPRWALGRALGRAREALHALGRTGGLAH